MVNFRFWKKKRLAEEATKPGSSQEPDDHVNLTDAAAREHTSRTPPEASGEEIQPSHEEITEEREPVSRLLSISREEEAKEDDIPVTDVNHCIEDIGFGKYQWKVIFVMGMMSFADSCEIWLSSVIISMFLISLEVTYSYMCKNA